jgi:uncharacterized protein YqeY
LSPPEADEYFSLTCNPPTADQSRRCVFELSYSKCPAKIQVKEIKMTNTGSENSGWSEDMQMSLLEKLKDDLKKAMLGKNNPVRDTIRIIMGEYPSLTVPITLESGKKTTRVKKPEEITSDDLLGIIRKLVKSEKIVLEIKKKDSSEYLEILDSYLPKMAAKEDITAWINENIDFSEFNNPMQAMGTIMKHFGKLADGNLVKQILQGLGK